MNLISKEFASLVGHGAKAFLFVATDDKSYKRILQYKFCLQTNFDTVEIGAKNNNLKKLDGFLSITLNTWYLRIYIKGIMKGGKCVNIQLLIWKKKLIVLLVFFSYYSVNFIYLLCPDNWEVRRIWLYDTLESYIFSDFWYGTVTHFGEIHFRLV